MDQLMPGYVIEVLSGRPTEADLECLNHLGKVLSGEKFKQINLDTLEQVANNPCNRLYVVRTDSDPGLIVATMTMITNEQIVGKKAWVEDVVTGTDHQGRGIAEAMMRYAMERVDPSVKHVNLTTAKDERAHKLYIKTGYVERNTVVYRYTPER